VSEQLPTRITTDVLRLKQVISNLISNAIKFTPESKNIYLIISYAQGKLSVCIEDEGIGIAAEAQTHIFDAFTQAETSTTRKFGGTGLGLAISSCLVKMLGGELKVSSCLGKGSRFYFSIPAPAQDLEQASKKTQHPEETINIDKSLQGHILVVEDNKVNQMLMSAILKKSQLSFDIVGDGLQAISAFKEKHYDLILMDENMPNLNGIGATQQIRLFEQQQGKTATPIIALTANAMTGDRERFLQAGMNEHITKPINKSKLLQCMAQFLRFKAG